MIKYKANIHKRKIYLTPRPKEDIIDGLVIMLSKPLKNGDPHFIATTIYAGEKEYLCPKLEEGDYIKSIFVKNKNDKTGKN